MWEEMFIFNMCLQLLLILPRKENLCQYFETIQLKNMRALIFFYLFCIFKLSSTQSVPKCPDFKAVVDANFAELLKGRWNLIRFYGYPKTSETKKASCIVLNISPSGRESEMNVETLITTNQGEIKNDTSVGVLKTNGVMEVDQEKEIEHSGIKMKVHIHVVVEHFFSFKDFRNINIFFNSIIYSILIARHKLLEPVVITCPKRRNFSNPRPF